MRKHRFRALHRGGGARSGEGERVKKSGGREPEEDEEA